jgi:hypothetical protein
MALWLNGLSNVFGAVFDSGNLELLYRVICERQSRLWADSKMFNFAHFLDSMILTFSSHSIARFISTIAL